jgi:formate dehydrogenase major subunit
MIWMGGSLSRNTNGLNTVRGVIGLQAITNNLTGRGKGLMTVRGGKPAGEDEFLSHYLPEDIAKKLHVRKVIYMMKKGSVDVLLLNGASRRYPDSEKTRAAIKKVGFVVYRGFFMDEEAELADLIIPPVFGFEDAGSVYGAQRQMVWRERVIEPLGECVPDWQFYRDLGRKIHGDKFPKVETPADIYNLFQSKIDSWKGITLERLKKESTGVTWPCESEHEDRRVGLYSGNNFATEDGKVHLHIRLAGPIAWKECKGSPIGDKAKKKDKAYPLIFMQGKVVHHWQHTMTNWSSLLGDISEGNVLEVHPDTVKDLGIKDGDKAVLETIKGKMTAKVKLTTAIKPGVVFTPSHPGPASPFEGNKGICINTIIPGYWDKAAAQFNGFGCRLVRLGQ